ncbi:MAG: 50S ribosomal protein L25/general stress protein Ctc [Bacteroidia bacterium]|nr:50S ribosomal protein L25/general stress protein Ctc [Bacteroidia bacterium]
MKSVSMSGSLRANVGKKDAKQLRNSGQVPCVLYGGEKQVTFSVDERAFTPLVFTPEVHTVDLDLDGQKFQAILQELQTHPVTDKIIHADFVQLIPGKSVTMNLPIKTVGNSAGVKAGGKLLKKLRKVAVRGPIEKMPEHITIDIENLNIGGAVLVRDLSYDGLTFLTPGNSTIVTVQVTRNVVEEPSAAAAAKPAAAAAPAAKK